MNFHSYTFFNFKLNNIRTLIFRGFKLSSGWKEFHNEVQFLLKYFKDNGYPESIVNKLIRKFLNSIFIPKIKEITVPKKIMYVKIPFINNYCSDFIKNEINKIMKFRYPYIDFRFLFVNGCTLQGLLNHKERIPDELSSGLVYKYRCGACGATYIGQTKKSLKTRASEHFGVSARTGALLARAPQSTVRDHIEECGSGRTLENFKKIRSFSSSILLKIYESLEISFNKPILNKDSSSYPLFLT